MEEIDWGLSKVGNFNELSIKSKNLGLYPSVIELATGL
jgi:hypothetical protein